MLEDIITTAINQTSAKAVKVMEDKMKSVTGGISIPGLF
jgi:DNA-binding protein YbaB